MSSATVVETKVETKIETKVDSEPEKVKVPIIEAPKSPKPKPPSIKTPVSATMPSALPKSPAVGRLDAIKQEEEDMKTPLTPPSAYTDFLKALSPAISTPSTGRSPVFDRLYSGKSTPLTGPLSQPALQQHVLVITTSPH